MIERNETCFPPEEVNIISEVVQCLMARLHTRHSLFKICAKSIGFIKIPKAQTIIKSKKYIKENRFYSKYRLLNIHIADDVGNEHTAINVSPGKIL